MAPPETIVIPAKAGIQLRRVGGMPDADACFFVTFCDSYAVRTHGAGFPLSRE